MRNKMLFIPSHALILCFLFLFGQAWGEMVDKIVAVVNNDIILSSELEETLKLMALTSPGRMNPEKKDQVSMDNMAKEEILIQLINAKLMKQEATKLRINISDQEVDNAMTKIRESSKMTKEGLLIAIAKKGISFEEYREKIREDIQRSALLGQEIHSKINVSDQEIEQYCQASLNSYQSHDAFNLQQILLTIPPDASEDQIKRKREMGEAILTKLKEGGQFSSLAQKYSECPYAKDGGNLGFVRIDQMISSLEEAISSLEPKEISNLIRSPLGFHIFKLLEKRSVKAGSTAATKEEIREKLLGIKTDEKINVWLQELRNNAIIEIKL